MRASLPSQVFGGNRLSSAFHLFFKEGGSTPIRYANNMGSWYAPCPGRCPGKVDISHQQLKRACYIAKVQNSSLLELQLTSYPFIPEHLAICGCFLRWISWELGQKCSSQYSKQFLWGAGSGLTHGAAHQPPKQFFFIPMDYFLFQEDSQRFWSISSVRWQISIYHQAFFFF